MSDLIRVLTDQPLFALAAIALLVVAVAFIRRPAPVRDHSRLFTAQQRRIGLDRCGHRCEFGLLVRCSRTATHADHFYPWARGGATSIRNLVGACGRHNLIKGARMPSAWQSLAIQARRRAYITDPVDRAPGEWNRGYA